MKKLSCLLTTLFWISFSAFGQMNADTIKAELYIAKDLNPEYSELINTGASMRLPLYFEPFTQGQYTGFIHKGTASTIMGQRMDSVTFMSVTANLNKEVFLKQGAELIEELEMKTLEGRPAKLFVIRFMADKTPINRMMFFTGDHQNTLLLTANYPELFSSLMRDVFLSSFMTVIIK